ncbi:MAG: amidohydrolase family protein [Planctomycetaceae bacterium]|nr:amidohydrolase family protein [Planctomycetaceae bacterium]
MTVMQNRRTVLLLICCLATTGMAQEGQISGDRTSEHRVGLRDNTPDVWALLHATVINPDRDPLEDATVVIRHGRIASIQKGGAAPADARSVDLTGRYIYPGFIDAYSEVSLSTDHLRRSPGYWNSNVVPQLSVADQLASGSANADLRRQGIVAQLRAPGEKIIRGQSALVSTGTSDPNLAILKRDVAQHVELTVASRSRTEYPGSPMGAVALARQAMIDADWYHQAWLAADADDTLPRPELNDALQALRPVMDGRQPVMIETSNEQFVLRAEKFAAEFGLDMIVVGSGHEYRRLPEIAAAKRPLIVPLNFPQPPNVSTQEIARNVTLESLMHWDIAPENPARLADAGLTFAFCTNRLSSIGDFLKNLRRAVVRGLSEQQALESLTVIPARMLGVEDQLGRVAPGRIASLVVTDGPLFQKSTKLRETWVDGRRFEHQPDPALDLSGVYEVRLQSPGELPSRLYLELKSGDKKSTGRISRQKFSAAKNAQKATDDKKKKPSNAAEASNEVIELKETSLRDFTATGQFSGKDWGQEGVIRFTIVFSEGSSDGNKATTSAATAVSGLGSFVSGDGKASTATVTRLSNVGASGEEAAKEQTLADSGVQNSKSDDGSQGAVADRTSGTGPAETEQGTDKHDSVDSPALFAVNYPLGAFGRTEPASTAELTALTHATIWTCGAAGILEDATLLIRNGVIVAVGTDVAVPKDCPVIHLHGAHVTPGIIDCHSHMATDGGVNESTQAVTCEVRIGDFIDADDIAIYRQLAGGVTTSNILHGSANPIGGQNQVIKLRWGATGEQMKFQQAPSGVKFALGENVKQSNWGDEYKSRYPQSRMGVEQTFRDAFEAAKAYAARMDAWQKNRRGLPPRRDLELEALREILEQRRWIHCHSYRQDEILALIRVLQDYNITIGTFQHILEGYKVADEMERVGGMGSAFSDWWAYKFEVQDAIPFGGALMHRSGVVVSFNSDDAELATHLNHEAAKAVKYGGVSSEDALKFVTLNPARQLRIDQYVGSLEPEKHADFVVWDGSPLSTLSRCEQTWIDGAKYFDRRDDEQQRRKIDEMRNAIVQKILASGEKMRGADEKDEDPAAQWLRHDEYCRIHTANDGRGQ